MIVFTDFSNNYKDFFENINRTFQEAYCLNMWLCPGVLVFYVMLVAKLEIMISDRKLRSIRSSYIIIEKLPKN